MPLINEIILTTCDETGAPHVAPLGLIANGTRWTLSPFRPSKTLTNLSIHQCCVASLTDDARVFAGCVTGRRSWPLVPTRAGYPPRLQDCLAHWELEVKQVEEDPLRPRYVCEVSGSGVHAAYSGYNRAFGAVVEASVLVSRLHILDINEIYSEFSRLKTSVVKTGGGREIEAFEWLENVVRDFANKT